MAPPPKLAVVVPVTLLAFLGAVAGQISYAPSTSPSAPPLSLSPARPNQISYPPRQSPPTYPPAYPPSPSPSSSIPPTYPPNPSEAAYSPSPSPLRRLIPPTYPPSKSPSPTTYPPRSSSTPPTYSPNASPSPSISSPPTYPPNASPSPSIMSPPTSPNPSSSSSISIPPTSPNPSPYVSVSIPPTYPPSKSPRSSVSSPPTYPPIASPSSSISSPPASPNPSPSSSISTSPTSPNPSPSVSISTPPTYPPSESPRSSISISIPPTYPPSESPRSSISSPPTYPPIASPSSSISSPPASPNPSPSSSISVPPTSPSPSPSSSISTPPTYAPIESPRSSISSPPTYPPMASTSLGPSPSIMTPSASPSPSPSNSISIPPTSPPSLSPSPSNPPSGLTVGYYDYLCPNAETIVREAVKSAIDSDRGTGAGLIRLFFHDCFVQGCDASVLLNTTGSGEATERVSVPNLTLRGFEVIDAAKDELEKECPNVVSCADIVAFAGRDSTFFLSTGASNNTLNDFAMPAGRYDGRVSLGSEALGNLPPPFAGLEQLRDMFAGKGLDVEDMVTLSGAHTVGRSRCSSFSGDRLPPHASDMNATLSGDLASRCYGGGGNTVVPQDAVTPDGLDSQYYRNVLNHEVLFASDAALLASEQTAGMVSANAFTPGLWEAKFRAAMVKMGRVGVKSSADGEIRKKCCMVN